MNVPSAHRPGSSNVQTFKLQRKAYIFFFPSFFGHSNHSPTVPSNPIKNHCKFKLFNESLKYARIKPIIPKGHSFLVLLTLICFVVVLGISHVCCAPSALMVKWSVWTFSTPPTRIAMDGGLDDEEESVRIAVKALDDMRNSTVSQSVPLSHRFHSLKRYSTTFWWLYIRFRHRQCFQFSCLCRTHVSFPIRKFGSPRVRTG